MQTLGNSLGLPASTFFTLRKNVRTRIISNLAYKVRLYYYPYITVSNSHNAKSHKTRGHYPAESLGFHLLRELDCELLQERCGFIHAHPGA